MATNPTGSIRQRKQSPRPCRCGSGLPADWLLDDEGEDLARVCDDCRERVAFAYDRASSCLDPIDDADIFDQEVERLDIEDEPVAEEEP